MFFNYRVKNPILYFFILISGKIRFEWHLTARKTISDEVPKLCLICLLLNVHLFIRKVSPHRDMVSEDIHISDPTAKKKTSKQYKIRTKYAKKKERKTNVWECCVYKNLNNPKFFIVSYFFRVWKTYYKKFFREKNQLLILQIAPRTIK